MKKIICLFLSILFNVSEAASLYNVNFLENIKEDQKSLKLNGIGARLATIFKVKVYVAGLYLEKQSMNPDVILNSNQTKKLVMKFMRSVDAQKLKEAWRESLAKNVQDITQFSSELDRFNQAMVDLKKDDSIEILFKHTGVILSIKGKTLPEIKNSQFSKALLSIWLKNPPNIELKKGILGLKIE